MLLIHDQPSSNSVEHFAVPELVDITNAVVGDIGVITLTGELDGSNSPELHDCLRDAIDAGLREVVLDVERLTYLDSSGLTVLWKAHQRMEFLGGHLKIFGPTSCVVRLLDVAGMGLLLNVYSVGDWTVPRDA